MKISPTKKLTLVLKLKENNTLLSLLASKIKYKSRYKICVKCEYFNILKKKCNKCGCLMKIKVRFNTFNCPLNKW